jgi:hypothetical protein
MAKRLGDALEWITDLLAGLEIRYQVVGGLAAVAYGSDRSLVDIDLYVPAASDLDRVVAAAADGVTRAPRRHVDEHWDLTFMKVVWGGWDIEIAEASTARVWDQRRGDWVGARIDFQRSETRDVDGVPIHVMPRAQLMDYKTGLGREVDRLDLQALAQTDV